ncbi:MAG: gliding motility-associated C-terminal domain-containing protein [candidate division KSB1 bacterium]|nr:gliding motility-associated C-terminal domain-containing protein [candidate division KSB1 bacterium]
MNWQRARQQRMIIYAILIVSIFGNHRIIFSQATENGKISGHIYTASHEPLAKVEVRAIAFTGPYFQRIAYSKDDGSYEITQLPVGQYYVRVQNKAGYLNFYYNNVLEKSDATLIKINNNQHVSGIDFYLERGGFISGRIFNKAGQPITQNCTIGFFDAKTYSLRGFIDGRPDGSYISPALPAGPHVVKASALPSGYLLTYYPNVSTQDSAQAIQVTVGDTSSNINFYLEKGGAIAGLVLGDEPDRPPIANAWVVVTNWQNGEWSSECYSNSRGYYCAAGLRPGTYRVQIYSVDPLRYHNEYYQNAVTPQEATPVGVKGQDTTWSINFSLKPVQRVTLQNDFIEVAVSDRYPGTNFTLGITGGLPITPYDNNKAILFGHPNPYTSFSTLWIDGKEVIYGSQEGRLLDDPYVSRDNKSIERNWGYGNLEIKQKVSLVVSEWSETKYEDTAQLQYIIINNDHVAHQVGIRVLFDTMLGQNDSALIRTSNYPFTGFEQDFHAPNIPSWWIAIEGTQRKVLFSAQGSIKGYGATPPDRFVIANWSNIFNTKWHYNTNGELGIVHDSAVAMWWDPVTVPPGKVHIICTYIGLGEMFPDKVPPYTENHIPAPEATNVPLNTNIQVDVVDDYMGVDSSSLEMEVNGRLVKPRITGTIERFTMIYDPEIDFDYNDTVSVVIRAADLAFTPNVMKPDSYRFFIKRDLEPPKIVDLYPQPKARQIPADTMLSFIVTDGQSGVDKDSLKISINGRIIHPEVEGTPAAYAVRYRFQPAFREMDSVSVRIHATDLVKPSNSLDSSFYFIIARDSLAPWVKYYAPLHESKEVNPDTNVIIELIDDFAGVDRNSIQLTINDIKVPFELSGDSSDYWISYGPPRRFRYNDSLSVVLTARDRARQPNIMRPFEFWFKTEIDTQPPVIVPLVPIPGDTTVNPTPLVRATITDDRAGVAANSIKMWVNGALVNFEQEGSGKRLNISYQFSTPRNYLEWIEVKIYAEDQSDPANAADTCRYRFRIMREKDLAPPYVTLYQPSKGESEVPPDCIISFHVRDDLSGVDSASIRVQVNGRLVNRTISGTVLDYRVEHRPNVPFGYGQRVLVEVDAHDLAKDGPNVMKTDSCEFITAYDRLPPEVVWIKPGPPGSHIPLDSEFEAIIQDQHTGVDLSSLRFKFQGQPISPQIAGDSTSYRWRFVPERPFLYNQQLHWEITGSDLAHPANRIRDSSFVFYTIEDREPPYITLRVPAPEARGIDFNPEILVEIKDDVAGVARDSIRMAVMGRLVSPTIAGSPQAYRLSYTDPIGFRPGQRVDIRIDAADLSHPSNRMKQDQYGFYIKDVFPDLLIKSFTLSEKKVMVHQPVQLSAEIEWHTAPIIDPIQVIIWDNERVLCDTMVQILGFPGSFPIDRMLHFNDRSLHQIKLVVDPNNIIKESNEENNQAVLTIDVYEGEVVVRPNPFTPNDDGFNDRVSFNFEKLGVVAPVLKLFDISGRMINTTTVTQGYEFLWDGNDRYGNPSQPGVYLYLLEDQNRIIAHGYVVLAR